MTGPLIPTGDPPVDVAEALDRLARVQAVRDLADEARTELRAWLDGALDRLEEMTGAMGATLRAADGSTATRTVPSVKATVTDAGAWEAWLGERFASSLTEVRRVHGQRLAATPADELPAGLLDALDAAGFVFTDRVAAYTPDEYVDGYPVTDDGRYVTADGEPVPGLVARPASSPQLRVVLSKVASARAVEALAADTRRAIPQEATP